MVSQVAEMTAHVRGEEVSVRTEAMVCNRCGFQLLTDEQSDAYTIASADAYREKHHLLTTAELREARGRLKMSFRTFAKYLRVSEASPKRWEAGLVQDEAMDELVRLKTDLFAARGNVRGLETRLGSAVAVPMQARMRKLTKHEWRTPDDYISIETAEFCAVGPTSQTCYSA